MTARVVGVHGVGNHLPGISPAQAAERLTRLWTAYLNDGITSPPSQVDLRVAYYADMLQSAGQQGAPGDDPESLDPLGRELLLLWVAQLGAPAEVAQGYGSMPVRQAASWVADRFGLDNRLLSWFVTRFFREVPAYLGDGARRAAARDRVASTIAEHAPQVVLAHSLGSVVAYEALWAHPELPVDLLVTLGSPLGMPDVVFDRLEPTPSSGRGLRPPSIARWVNLADPGDLIAIPRHLARRFAGVDLDQEDLIHTFDFHRVANYLSCAATRAVLVPYLRRPTVPPAGDSGNDGAPPEAQG
jgi:hypothetical protein